MRGGGSPSDAEDSGELPYRADFFHLIFALASMYVFMVMVMDLPRKHPCLKNSPLL